MNREDIQEEWEIREQEILAEERDYYMFHRIVNGMIAKRGASSSSSTSSSFHSENEKSIASILRTRYKKVESDKSNNDSDDVLACDELEEYNLSAARTNESDRPPETIFIMDM